MDSNHCLLAGLVGHVESQAEWYKNFARVVLRTHRSRLEVHVQEAVSQRAARRDPMVGPDPFAYGSRPPDSAHAGVLVYRDCHDPSYAVLLRSLAEELLDGEVVIALYAIDVSTESLLPLVAANSASTTPIQAAVSAPFPAPITQADTWPCSSSQALRMWALATAQMRYTKGRRLMGLWAMGEWSSFLGSSATSAPLNLSGQAESSSM
eukprot:16433550-Heterocapsa_arctica.AAC.3